MSGCAGFSLSQSLRQCSAINIFELAASSKPAKLNETLNPTIWTKHEHLKNAVKDQILIGAEEYCSYLGLTEDQVQDIVVSGDNASFKYTNESTIDVVVVADLDPDPTFREFFNENKYKYNGQNQVQRANKGASRTGHDELEGLR